MSTNNNTQWGSRIGFILAGAGSAIGLGAIWKFPFWAGTNGGAAFDQCSKKSYRREAA